MKSPDKEIKKNKTAAHLRAIDLFAEAGLLKKVKRSGWWVAGIKDPESVAEHSFRCAVIGYYIAHVEKVDRYKVLVMALFDGHGGGKVGQSPDGSTRTLGTAGDIDRVAIKITQIYVKKSNRCQPAAKGLSAGQVIGHVAVKGDHFKIGRYVL